MWYVTVDIVLTNIVVIVKSSQNKVFVYSRIF